jgi:lipopolysaccharide export LptBFGC system permease protein LptF
MTLDINFVLLTVMVSCVAFVGAANAKGTARLLVSYLLAFVCLAITAFYLSQYIASASQKRAKEIAGEAGKIIEEKLEEIELKEEEIEEDEDQIAIDDYKSKANGVLDKINDINQKLSHFRAEAETDADYEAKSGQASFYLGEANRYKEEVRSLIAPEAMRTVHESLMKAAEMQHSACARLKRYYNAEDASEETQMARLYRSTNRQAASLISRLEMDLR